MPDKLNKYNAKLVVQLIRGLLGRCLQTRDIYPVRYYKKGKRTKFN
ncbi:MAG: hypothetical protein ABI707_02735 [Ferruginibacter sp.]